jgi:GAF domain-containing protein
VAAIAVPLSLQGRPIGALTVSDRASSGKFNDEDIHVLGLLANHAALAIENARLLQQGREAARLEGAVETARGLAHELNHPLAIIVGQAEILRLLTDPATPLGQIEPKLIEIVEASQLLADKIRRLQRIVRVETNEMPGIGRYIDLDRSSAIDGAIG